ncbi:A/G-specific adenine glycosylase [Algisphaera agarilytica]|uniref:Adenine DNA glycosylase n=1 Tax=Algisphaera agarilytica TaxID=1385975 RepID=A0A7X0LMC4_9BACT|nr:A/G-specific adenine glycosylase [Algisphaera agarilytica]MBB6430878.1 A/G-specific adenine glycosylase [Algisphaera agarilytica]
MPKRAPNSADFPIAALLDWYRQNQRELPFRPRKRGGRWEIKPNPYHVLVSEAMAQQTQIATVVPYFERFVEAFPTVDDLAEADEQRVLTLWQGLGYYRRARNLHAAARMIVDGFDGQVPKTAEQLLKLPGVGRYTAGAVASVAHNTPAPIVDGNVARVFARYFLLEEAIDKPATLKQLWQLADELVQASDAPRDFNQGVMELGATVCTPKSTKCLYCPLHDSCAAHAAGRVAELPVKTPKKKPVAVTHTILAIHRNGKYLFEQRPAKGLWSNMWQMPTLEDSDVSAATETIKNQFGLSISEPEPVSSFTHQTTHRTIQFALTRCEVKSGRLHAKRGEWRPLSKLDDLPLAKPQLTAIDLL